MWPLVVVILAVVAIFVAAVVCAFIAEGGSFDFWDEHEQN